MFLNGKILVAYSNMKDTKSTAVLLTTYNRPYFTKGVFEIIKKVQPKKLFISSDGPKNKKNKKLVEQTRSIFENIGWDCKVYKNYSEENLGLGKRMSSAITWFFDNVREGIVLEDDCLPDLSFFRYCEELLEKYRHDGRVMHITGDNFLAEEKRIGNSYYFSKYPHCWGWASWSRAWKSYDDKMERWTNLRESGWLRKKLDSKIARTYWKRVFDLTYKNKINSWAYKWQYSCWLENGITVVPKKNLVKNIGQGIDATNTKMDIRIKSISAKRLKFPLKHPVNISIDEFADSITEKNRFITPRNLAGIFYKSILR